MLWDLSVHEVLVDVQDFFLVESGVLVGLLHDRLDRAHHEGKDPASKEHAEHRVDLLVLRDW